MEQEVSLRLITREHKEDAEVALIGLGLLSPMYTLSSASKGRRFPEEPNNWRTCFERDNDRIIYSQAYRRLRNKTQVVLLPTEQHLTTRMIHTEEVYQVARGICSFLGLNQKLAEAIARGHDLGHVPFGHAGEKALTDIMQDVLGNQEYKFHHARYGLEIVDRVEKDGKGLNLTEEVRDGILKHTLGASGLSEAADLPITPEGRVVRLSDKIAYLCSDLDDAIRVGIIKEIDIPCVELDLLGPRKSKWIGSLNKAVVESSIEAGDISFTGEYFEAFETIRNFMYKRVYGSGRMEAEFVKAKKLVKLVFMDVLEKRFERLSREEAAKKTLDVVACMTDQSIVAYFNENFVPKQVY
jgi:dGTPase